MPSTPTPATCTWDRQPATVCSASPLRVAELEAGVEPAGTTDRAGVKPAGTTVRAGAEPAGTTDRD
ncbi:hypothetical protein CH251_22390 [Rhodococcus sp. 06-462-5]|nr:hypothetical protein CH251_22390 [Rhodococcus sp. 06-462-5]OZE68872.1 hypothetical protein CH270_03680 [Rhodococcus sp. 02-925g]